MKFKEYKGLDLAGIAADVLGEWDARDTFHKSITTREGHPTFVFYEGPPSANGMPGIHHVMARTIKDVFCRYKTQQGYLVHRKAGWDTHGLPVELGVEKKLGITKEDIGKKISIEEYNRTCREAVMEFTGKWEDLTRKMGYWVNMDDPYITYDNKYIETLWWLLKQLFDKGLLYKGYTIQPYSPAAGTGLSTHELNQPGCYRDVKDTTCTSQFRVIRDAKSEKLFEGIEGELYFLAWTTTPWTLPSNTALAVGPAIEYVKVKCLNPYTDRPQTVILAKELLGSYFTKKMEGTYEIMEGSWKGPELEGIRYEQLIPWVKPEGDAFRVIVGDYVTTSDGTGIVHIAPTFGADDDRVAKAAGIPPLFMVDRAGKNQPMVDRQGKFFLIEDLDPEFVKTHVDAAKYGEYAGRYVKNAYDDNLAPDAETLDVEICMMLKQEDKVFKIEKHTHNYPHCWRTDKPVLYYPLDSWFIRTTAVRERLMELNDQIKWKPAATGTGRFGKWLENIQDWNLSRSRYWGTPLPIWRTEDNTEERCISSVEELYNAIDDAVKAGVMASNPLRDKGFEPGVYTAENYDKIDLHRPYVDDIVLVSPSGKPMHRELDLIDVWFDSGAMPYAQQHYPFENREGVESGRLFPADFIAEGVDQTRGWFYTLHAIAGMIFDSNAYKAVVSNGLVLDKDGNKMSKRKGNAVDPFGAIEKHGSDPLRWYMISNTSPWENLKYDDKGVIETARKFFATLYNTYSFFALYANVDGFTPDAKEVPLNERPEIDRWIISLLNSLVAEVDADLADYEPTRAARAISDFVIDNLSNWYVRLNRKRFWGGEMNADKLAAYQTLYQCLLTVSKLMAPIAPFFADRLWRDLTGADASVQSVHLELFPEVNEAAIDKDLEKRMSLAQTITSMALALRRKVNLKVRQPLQAIMIPVADDSMRAALEAISPLVKNEINVKEVKLVAGDDSAFVKRVKPDFKKLGPKHGKAMKAVAAAIQALDQTAIRNFEADGFIDLDINGENHRVEASDVDIFSEDIPGWLVANQGNVTIALDITVTPELRREGIARDIVNRIQNIRKDRDYNITDRITLNFEKGTDADEAITEFADYISQQVLASALTFGIPEGNEVETLDIDGLLLKVAINKN